MCLFAIVAYSISNVIGILCATGCVLCDMIIWLL